MIKRCFDVLLALLGLLLTAPVIAIAALAIRLTSPGPVIYRARRAGLGGRPFTMFKLRTMHWTGDGAGSRITAFADRRVFPIGALLRRTKVDELPQLWNILRGDMAIIGPRPEDPELVEQHYSESQRETLRVRPGLASPGSLYHDTHLEPLVAGPAPELRYVSSILPIKLALDLVYVAHASVWYDVRLIARTLTVIAGKLAGRRRFPEPPEISYLRFQGRALLRASGRLSAAHGRLATILVVALCCTAALPAACADDRVPEPPRDAAGVFLVGAGDIADCGGLATARTASLLEAMPGTVFTTGDNAYPDGSAANYRDCYNPTWGRLRSRTRPVPGNHDYLTPGAAGYFGYFGAAAGPSGRGYYSYDIGRWHIVALSSGIALADSSAQVRWLRADLAASSNRCALAYWHRPRFSSGSTHGGSADTGVLWLALYDAGAEVVLNGHEHNYERFTPQTPDGQRDDHFGIREFVVGTGGASASPFGVPAPNSEVRLTGTSGVLALALEPDGYRWWFVPARGTGYADSGAGRCHDAPPRADPGRSDAVLSHVALR